jgi:hypothetical protein
MLAGSAPRAVSLHFAVNGTGSGRRRQNPIRADHLLRATGVSMFELLDWYWTRGGRRHWRLYSPRAREDDSALDPRHCQFFVRRVSQRQNGAAEKQCVEEKVQRTHIYGCGQEDRQVDP